MNKYPADLLKKIKLHLQSEQKKLKSRLVVLNQEDPFSDPERVNDNAASDTEAKEETDHERIEALKEDTSAHLTLIGEALDRVSDGSYGFCKKCTKMIDTDRLAAYPTAVYCIDCQSKSAS